MSAPMFPNLLGVAEAFGAAVSDAQPDAPVLPPLTDETAGPLSPPLPEDTDPARDEPDESTARRVQNSPIPLIGTVPLGGVVLDARTITPGAAADSVIGENLKDRPGVLGVIVQATLGGGTAYIVPDSGALVTGFPVPTTPMFLPLRQLTVRTTTPAAVSYIVVGSDLGAPLS